MKKFIIISGITILSFVIVAESLAANCEWNGTKLTVTGSGKFSGCGDDWENAKKR